MINTPPKKSWVWPSILLMASVVILLGVWRDLAPEVILGRAALASAAAGILAKGVSLVVDQLTKVS